VAKIREAPAALDSLTAALETSARIEAALNRMFGDAVARAERAERERDDTREVYALLEAERDAAQRMANHMVTLKGDNAWAIANAEKARAEAAEARAQKAEAALREIAEHTGHADGVGASVLARSALTALDEPPTEQIPGAGQDGC
jgi:DNA-binding PadR family transcriptional regulator